MAPADEATHTPEADALSPQPADSLLTSENDPPEKDWKAEYARLRKDYDAKASRLKEVEKAVTPEEEKKETPKVAEDETDFKIENAGRIKLVREEYKQELAELQATGAKLTVTTMEKALRLAESKKGIGSTSEAMRQQANASAPSVVNRDETSLDDVKMTDTDSRFGITPETKQKWKGLVEGQG